MGGEMESNSGVPDSSDLIDWAFRRVLPIVAPQYAGVLKGSLELQQDVFKETVVTRTGRICARVDYCAARNTLFQGLAADGAKIALYRLVQKFRAVNFIHDEFILEIPQAQPPEETM